jgi:nitrogen fixation protein NifZ
MALQDLQPGDIVYAAQTIYSDGEIPGYPENSVLAAAGTRGVIINVGHLEENPEQELMLVRFENDKQELGPPVGCWVEELKDAQ